MGQSKDETVAILLATYNGEKYIERQIDSIIGQTHQNFICYIHDDGSTDGTKGIISRIAASDHRFRIVGGEPTGSAKANFMFLLGMTEEKYIMFSDQDDIWLPEKIEEEYSQIRQLEAQNGDIPICVFCNLKVADQDGKETDPDFMQYSGFNTNDLSYKSVLIGNVVPGCSMIMNKALRDITVGCGDIRNIAMHDWWCASIASLYGILFFLDKKLNLYCQHDRQVVGAAMKRTVWERAKCDLKSIESGKLIARKKEWGDSICRQGIELLKLEGIKETRRKEIEKLVSMKNKSRVEKILFFKNSQWGDRAQRAWLGMCY